VTGSDLARALRILARRRPFTTILIELLSGDRILMSHPEAVRQFGELFLYRAPDRGQRLFAAAGVCQIIDPPAEPSSG
jgi:hypothetical protein